MESVEPLDRRRQLRRGDDQSMQESLHHLEAALESRHTIALALGLIMATYRIGEEQAFNYLRRVSNHRNVKLRDLADGIASEFERTRQLALPPGAPQP